MNITLKQKQLFILHALSTMTLKDEGVCGCSNIPNEFLNCDDCLMTRGCNSKSYSDGTIKQLAIEYIKEFDEVEILTALVMGSAYEI